MKKIKELILKYLSMKDKFNKSSVILIQYIFKSKEKLKLINYVINFFIKSNHDIRLDDKIDFTFDFLVLRKI